jgi:hypothetical protein
MDTKEKSKSGKMSSTYCPGCNRAVQITMTRAPAHRGHANLPDGAEMVCLDFGAGCTDGRCPMTGAPGIVMGVRLAKSHLADEHFPRILGRCDACGNVARLEVLDEQFTFCPICESTTRWMRLDVDEDGSVVVTMK